MNSLSILALMLIVVACENSGRYRPGLAEAALKSVNREPANVDPRDKRICFFDRLSEPHLSNEIAFAEATSRFIPPEIRSKPVEIKNYFLNKHGSALAAEFTTEAQAKSCGSVACLYQLAMAKSPNYGKYAYLFFLTTGVSVSATNQVPMAWNPGDSKLSEWLFDENEMRALAVVALTTTGRGARVFPAGRLTSIFRIERGKAFAMMPFACGLAYSNGIIHMLDSCLALTTDPRVISTSLHRSTLHEIGHQIDFGSANSRDPEWLGFSGWTNRDITNRELKVAKEGWAYDSKLEGFPRDYAATSPLEDFAEAIAYYRFDPPRMFASSSKKFKFIQEKFFSGRDFRSETIQSQTRKILTDRHLERIDETLPACMKLNPLSLSQINTATRLEGPLGLCVVEMQRKAIANEVAELSFDEPTRCSSGTKAANDLMDEVVRTGEEETVLAIKQFAHRDAQIAAREELDQRIDAKQIYLRLYDGTVAEKDFIAAMTDAFNDQKTLFNGIPDVNWKSELERFLGLRALERVKKDVDIATERFFASSANQLEASVGTVWNKCAANHLDYGGSPTGAIVTSGTDLVKTTLLACLNQELRPSTDRVIESRLVDFARSLGYRLQSNDSDLKRVLLILARESATLSLQKKLNRQVEVDREYLENYLSRNKNALQGWIASKNYVNLEFSQQMFECTKGIHEFLENALSKNAKLVALQSSLSINQAEVANCREAIERASNYTAKLENYRRNIARRIFTIAHRAKATDFPLEGGWSNFRTVGQENQECQRFLRTEVSRQPLKGPSVPSRVFNAAIDEVCINGRYAGRLAWSNSERPIMYDGVQYFGMAVFDGDAPGGAENGFYLRAVKRYMEMRTEERLKPNDLSWLQ